MAYSLIDKDATSVPAAPKYILHRDKVENADSPSNIAFPLFVPASHFTRINVAVSRSGNTNVMLQTYVWDPTTEQPAEFGDQINLNAVCCVFTIETHGQSVFIGIVSGAGPGRGRHS